MAVSPVKHTGIPLPQNNTSQSFCNKVFEFAMKVFQAIGEGMQYLFSLAGRATQENQSDSTSDVIKNVETEEVTKNVITEEVIVWSNTLSKWASYLYDDDHDDDDDDSLLVSILSKLSPNQFDILPSDGNTLFIYKGEKEAIIWSIPKNKVEDLKKDLSNFGINQKFNFYNYFLSFLN